MKYIYLLALVCFISTTAQAQLSGVSIQLVYQDDGTVEDYPEGFNTWKIYAHFDAADDYLSAVFAAVGDTEPLLIGSSTNTIWNTPLGGATRDAITDALIEVAPIVAYDSYVAVGDASSGNEVTILSSMPSGSVIQDAFDVDGNEVELDANLEMTDGAWFNIPFDADSFAEGEENKVLIAQITTDGDVEICVNFQVFPGGMSGELTEYNEYCETALAPPITSVKEAEAQGQMIIQPNPMTTAGNIMLSNDYQQGAIEILDLSGRTVFFQPVNSNSVSLDGSTLSNGLYLVRLLNEQGDALEVQKLIVE